MNLQKMFIRKGRRAVLPARSDPNYDKVLRTRHAAVLGLIALIRAYPFTVPEWMPPLIDYLSKYATDPSPISNTLRTFGAEFQKTHQVCEGFPFTPELTVWTLLRTIGTPMPLYSTRIRHLHFRQSYLVPHTVSEQAFWTDLLS